DTTPSYLAAKSAAVRASTVCGISSSGWARCSPRLSCSSNTFSDIANRLLRHIWAGGGRRTGEAFPQRQRHIDQRDEDGHLDEWADDSGKSLTGGRTI